jgi:hypothetical protein
MPLSASRVVGDGSDLSLGAKADVGDGTSSRRRLPDWDDVKVLVDHENAEVGARDCGGYSVGVGGPDSANDTAGSEFFRFGCISLSQLDDKRRPPE